MSAFDEHLGENPEWDRTALVCDIRECFLKHRQSAAYRVTDDLDTLTVLQGAVEPFDSDGETYYSNTTAYLIGRTCLDGRHVAVLTFGSIITSQLYRYDLEETGKHVGPPSYTDGQEDRYNQHMLNRTHFDPQNSEIFAKRLFGASAILLNWHAAIGVQPQLISYET